MSTEQNLVTISRIADADLSAAQYKFVKQTATGTVELCDSEGETAIGVLQNNPGDTQAATVAVGGVTRVLAGATVAIGAEVMTDATARAITATATNAALGEAISGGAVGEVISVLLRTRSL